MSIDVHRAVAHPHGPRSAKALQLELLFADAPLPADPEQDLKIRNPPIVSGSDVVTVATSAPVGA